MNLIFALCLITTGECHTVELPIPDQNRTPYACMAQAQASIASYFNTLQNSRAYRIAKFGCAPGVRA